MNVRPIALLALLLALICFISPFRPAAAELFQHPVDAEYQWIRNVN